MADVFSRNTVDIGPSFTADGVQVDFRADGITQTAGLVIQRLGYRYMQQVSRIYEVGSSRIYMVAGRTNGDLTMDRIVGPVSIVSAYYRKYGDVCNAKTNGIVLTMQPGLCSPGGRGEFTQARSTEALSGVVLVSVGKSLQAQDSVINESTQALFSGLDNG